MKLDRATRTYRMGARGEAVAATKERICAATISEWLAVPYDEMTLDAIAARAGVTRQTVLRHYGSKEQLVTAAAQWYAPQIADATEVEPGDVVVAVQRIVDLYETMGDANMRMLEVEDRFDVVRDALARGRKHHRAWVESTFAPLLPGIDRSADHRRTVDALYAATDVGTWKLLRRDFGRSAAATRVAIRTLVEGVLATVDNDEHGGTP